MSKVKKLKKEKTRKEIISDWLNKIPEEKIDLEIFVFLDQVTTNTVVLDNKMNMLLPKIEDFNKASRRN